MFVKYPLTRTQITSYHITINNRSATKHNKRNNSSNNTEHHEYTGFIFLKSTEARLIGKLGCSQSDVLLIQAEMSSARDNDRCCGR